MFHSCKSPNSIYRILAGELIIIGACLVITVITSAIFSRGFYWKNMEFQMLYGLLIGYPLFKGNALTGFAMSKLLPWQKKPLRTLILGFMAGMLYSVICILATNLLWFNLTEAQPYSVNTLFDKQFFLMLSEMITTIIITLGYYLVDFFKEWKILLLKEEHFKREALALQFEALKNQVNPHFLFNSLNVLTSLVETDQKSAVRFIKQLSEVYRYVLEQKDKELIDLQTELQFVNAYIYLQKIRFDSNLVVDQQVTNQLGQIIPLSLQMLVENAIKHNVISEGNPLNIKIFEENGYLIVQNNLQKKMAIHGTGSIGLNNIRDRYAYFSALPVIVNETGDSFTVKLPVIAPEI